MRYLKLLPFFFLFFTQLLFAQVNINTASKAELKAISGIGDAKAESIIKYRKANGKFKSIDEIKNIHGIGEKLFAEIKKNGVTKGKTNLDKVSNKPLKKKTKKSSASQKKSDKKTKKKKTKKSKKESSSKSKKDKKSTKKKSK